MSKLTQSYRFTFAACAAAVGALAAAVGLPIGGSDSPAEALHICDELEVESYTFPGSVIGSGWLCVDWGAGLDVVVTARSIITPATDRVIGARAQAWDRCGSGQWIQYFDSDWVKTYSGTTVVTTPHTTSFYQDCPSGHFQKFSGRHLFSDYTPDFTIFQETNIP